MVSLGFAADGKRVRKKVSGKTKAEVRDKLKELHSELDAGGLSSVAASGRAGEEQPLPCVGEVVTESFW